jgi:adenylate kinase
MDGFPRTLGQAEALNQLMEKENPLLSAVVDYELPLTEIVSRLSGRRICEKCKRFSTSRDYHRGCKGSAISAVGGCSSGRMTGLRR